MLGFSWNINFALLESARYFWKCTVVSHPSYSSYLVETTSMCLFKKHFLDFNRHVWCPISTGSPPHCLSFSCTYLLLLGNLEKHQTLILLDVFLLDMLKIKQSSKHSNVVPYVLNFSKNETFDKNINIGRYRI